MTLTKNENEKEKTLKKKQPTLSKTSTYPEYLRWVRGIKVALNEEDLWDEETDLPINSEEDGINDTIMDFIESYMDATLLNEVSNHGDGSTLIQELKARFEYKRKKEGKEAKSKYYSLKKGTLSIEELAREIETLGKTFTLCLDLENLSEEDKIEQLLMSLPVEYSSAKREIEKGDFTNLFEVVEILMETEEAINNQVPRNIKSTINLPNRPKVYLNTLFCYEKGSFFLRNMA